MGMPPTTGMSVWGPVKHLVGAVLVGPVGAVYMSRPPLNAPDLVPVM